MKTAIQKPATFPTINLRGWAAALILFASVSFLTACGESEADQKQKQVDELTREINQIDSAKLALEQRLDSLSQEKESLYNNYAQEKGKTGEFIARLNESNKALVGARAKSEALSQELNKWKERAEKLSAENKELKEKITQLTTRAEEAEKRAATAEAKLEAAETKIREMEAERNSTYFISALDVEAYKGDEKFAKDRIKKSADRLSFTVTIGRPPKATGGPIKSKFAIVVEDPDGAVWARESFDAKGDKTTIDIKVEKPRKLVKGRYVVDLLEGANKPEHKLKTSFVVQ